MCTFSHELHREEPNEEKSTKGRKTASAANLIPLDLLPVHPRRKTSTTIADQLSQADDAVLV